jgi:hypothetical protein
MRRYLARSPEKRAAQRVRVNRRSKERRAELKGYVTAYLLEHPCVDCGEPDPIVLEFDHVRGEKLYNVGDIPRQACGMATLLAEIAKCEVRCANCHRRATHARRLLRAVSVA